MAKDSKKKTLTDPNDMRPFPKTSKRTDPNDMRPFPKTSKRKVILSSEERQKKNIIRKYANSDVEMPVALQKFIRGNTSTPPTPPASKSKEIKLDYQQPLPRDYPKKLKSGGRAGYKHGGAAKRGHGCEIK